MNVRNVSDGIKKGFTREEAKVCVGKGWSKLIDEVYDLKESFVATINITTVKEKFGGLRIYYNVEEELIPGRTSEEFYEHLVLIEERSMTICEECGEDGELTSIKGWLKTRCAEHEE